jgi:hypothetical protein
MKRLMLLLSLLLISTDVSFAQAGKKAPAAVQTATQASKPAAAPQPVAQRTDTRMSELDYYKKMYEQASSSATNANTLTQWTLNSVAGVILLVIGGQLFFNYNINKRKLETIEGRLRNEVLTQANDTKERFRIDIKEELNATRISLQKTFDGHLNSVQKDVIILSNKMDTIPAYLAATERFTKQDYYTAFDMFLHIAEVRITEEAADKHAAIKVLETLNQIPVLTQSHYDRVIRIIAFLKKAEEPIYSLLQSLLDIKPVSDGNGGYSKNAPKKD